jgi:DNA uptake protein ComE-like DNA-binding protein
MSLGGRGVKKGVAVLAAIIAMVFVVRLREKGRPPPPPGPAPVVVGIGGAVRTPGVYLLEGARASLPAAVETAGGVPGASVEALGEASREAGELRSGDSILVEPRENGGVQFRFEPLPGVARLTLGKKIDPNRAAEEDLLMIPRMRKAFAQYIVKRREGRPWTNISELDEIFGVGPKTIERWEKYLEVEKQP